MGFTCEEDGRRVQDVLAKRLGKYGLAIHPEKTRLVPFHHPRRRSNPPDGSEGSGPGTFDLLGFTHIWGRSWTKKGQWVIQRRTAKGRFKRALLAISQWCRANRHRSLAEQQQKLSQKLRGHYAYYGITGNGKALSRFGSSVNRLWRKWLSRRRAGNAMTWTRFNRILARYPLPRATVVHSVYKARGKPIP